MTQELRQQHQRSQRSPASIVAGVAIALAALSGCAALRNIDSDVSSFSQWPADRKPSSYAFERLPSQQAQPQRQDELEAAARDALGKVGFVESADTNTADVTVQLGARITRQDRSPWDDPFWHGYYGRWPGRWGWGGWGGWGPRWPYDASPYYQREVGVLIRDRQTGQPLYESHASNDGTTQGGPLYLSAMYEAALKDFPQPAVSPRRVSVPVAQQ